MSVGAELASECGTSERMPKAKQAMVKLEHTSNAPKVLRVGILLIASASSPSPHKAATYLLLPMSPMTYWASAPSVLADSNRLVRAEDVKSFPLWFGSPISPQKLGL